MREGPTAGRKRHLSEPALLDGATKAETRTVGRRIAPALCRIYARAGPADSGRDRFTRPGPNEMERARYTRRGGFQAAGSAKLPGLARAAFVRPRQSGRMAGPKQRQHGPVHMGKSPQP